MRRRLGIPLKGKVILSLEKGKITLTPVKDIFALKGAFRTNKKPLSAQQLHDLFAQSVADEIAVE